MTPSWGVGPAVRTSPMIVTGSPRRPKAGAGKLGCTSEVMVGSTTSIEVHPLAAPASELMNSERTSGPPTSSAVRWRVIAVPSPMIGPSAEQEMVPVPLHANR